MNEDRLHSIGKRGEAFVRRVCDIAFLPDFVFANPCYPKGRFQRELADAVIAFERALIVVQIKTADPASHTAYSASDEFRWRTKQSKKATDQVVGAFRTLQRGIVSSATDRRGDRFEIRGVDYAQVFGIVIIDHKYQRPAGMSCELLENRCSDLPIMHLTFDEFVNMCQELSTIGDLIDYLEWRLLRCSSVTFCDSGELDLLATFRSNRPAFDGADHRDACLVVQGGIWDAYRTNREVRVRNQSDAVSYIVDDIAYRLYEAVEYGDPKCVDFAGLRALPKSRQYRDVLVQLASLRRVERRGIGHRLVQKSHLAIAGDRPRYFVTKYENRIPMLFIVFPGERIERACFLYNLAIAAKIRFQFQSLLAIAIEPISERNRSVDCVMLDAPIESDKDNAEPWLVDAAAQMFADLEHETTYEFEPRMKSTDGAAGQKRRSHFKKRKRKDR